jgi:hypothetical protein
MLTLNQTSLAPVTTAMREEKRKGGVEGIPD